MSLRMGLETEVQQVYLTFKRTDRHPPTDPSFWPEPVAGVKIEDTMIMHNPILVPDIPNPAVTFPNIGGINWDADWGFIVVGDSFSRGIEPIGGVNTAYSRCMLELGHAANFTHEDAHWAFARRAARVFHQAMLKFSTSSAAVPDATGSEVFFDGGRKWYPLHNFITYYNAQIVEELRRAGSPFPANKWQLRISPSLNTIITGGGPIAGTWQPYIQVEDSAWTDTQVNYEIDLEFLYTNQDLWFKMWQNTWFTTASFVFAGTLDPPNGHKSPANMEAEVYRNQLTVALWKLAKKKADEFFTTPGCNLVVSAVPGYVNQTQYTQIKALVMYIFAFGAISPVLESGTYKGSYSQFSKTSPASIARAIHWPGLQEHFTSRAAIDASNAAFAALRTYANVYEQMPPGSAYNTAGLPNYNSAHDKIFEPIPAAPPVHPNPYLPDFAAMWLNTFNQAGAVAQANNFGYQSAAPFNCYWAFAHTAKEATVYNGNKIKILMESRFSHNRLNIGFNPTCVNAAFPLAYNSILALSDVADKASITQRMATQLPEVIGSQTERANLVRDLAAAQAKGVH